MTTALNSSEFDSAAKAAGYIYNGDPCEVPGKPMNEVEDRICEYIHAREALRAAEAIVYAFEESDAWGPDASDETVMHYNRITATLRNRQATYEAKLNNLKAPFAYDVYSTSQVAEIVGVTTARIRQLAVEMGVGWDIGRERLFSKEDVQTLRNRPDGRRKTT